VPGFVEFPQRQETEKVAMTDEIDDELSGELGEIQYERIDAGCHVVIGELRINGRRIPCRNPAYGFGALDQEVCDYLRRRRVRGCAKPVLRRWMRATRR
jgi:hypothetical protein